MSMVKDFKIVKGEVKIIYVKFDDATLGRNLIHSDVIRRSNSCVPVHKVEVRFGLRRN